MNLEGGGKKKSVWKVPRAFSITNAYPGAGRGGLNQSLVSELWGKGIPPTPASPPRPPPPASYLASVGGSSIGQNTREGHSPETQAHCVTEV